MRLGTLVVGAGAGGILAYLFDPDRGRRRRALVRDQLVKARRITRETVDAKWRDTRNRATGVLAEARAALESGVGQVADIRSSAPALQRAAETGRRNLSELLRSTSPATLLAGAGTAAIFLRTARRQGLLAAALAATAAGLMSRQREAGGDTGRTERREELSGAWKTPGQAEGDRRVVEDVLASERESQRRS